ncbi:hypothetical protein F8144_33610 [Streptomyces triticiradicis]|uniref:Htaa domain-containing protein n=1 Tax=Streptomyces triticiradicis TaxID=2651189 RepID=A0A7J5D6W2_9ACTN|nr:hypothetical protein F8144_33610 [Streptomyces triticiradicis]
MPATGPAQQPEEERAAQQGGGTAVRLDDLPATLTARGARSFAGYYTAGTPLDPVSLEADVRAPARPSATPTAAPSAAPAKRTGRTAPGAIEDGAVDWGVRRTFREYVTGPVAAGRWALASGARDGGALFRFPAGEGTYDRKKHVLKADFHGSVRFTGRQGLDLGLGGLRVTVAEGRGTLYADVTSADLTGKKVPLVSFGAEDLAPKDGLLQLVEAPSELTARGAEAFGGMYRAGTEMDPLTLSIALTDEARLPALPDLGESASPSPEARTSRTPDAKTAGAPRAGNTAGDGPGGGAALPIGLALGALAAAAVALGLVRGRRTPTG